MTATYVLVPGAGGAAWYWHRVEPRLRDRGHEVVPVDLPADDDRAGFAEYADAVVRAAGGCADVVLVAQSMGAYPALLACRRLPVSLLVLVNPMTPREGETAGEWWANTGQRDALRENDRKAGRPPEAGFDPLTHFLHDLPPDLVAEATAHERAQSDTPFGQPWTLEGLPDVPTRVLIGRDDRFFPAGFQRRVVRERLGITPDEMPGGHLVALVHPTELADRLEAYRASA